MWLEGAIRSGWSVSQMRGKRWETLGTPGKPPKIDDAAEASGAVDFAGENLVERGREPAGAPQGKAVEVAPLADAEEEEREAPATAKRERGSVRDEEDDEVESRPASKPGKRLSVDVDELPNDLAEAFEQFKLAIIAHRRSGWSETTPAMVVECLDALKELALAEA
jgi:hypothetical protein